MKVYISGKITGDKHYKRKFAKAERKLKRAGYDVINPARIGACLPKNTSWSEYMTISAVELRLAETIYMLSDWTDSMGARIEHELAEKYNMNILYE